MRPLVDGPQEQGFNNSTCKDSGSFPLCSAEGLISKSDVSSNALAELGIGNKDETGDFNGDLLIIQQE